MTVALWVVGILALLSLGAGGREAYQSRNTDAFLAGCLPLALGILLSVAWGVLAIVRWLVLR